jgi:hypothetical protein
LALLITILCSLPVLIWNAQHEWITVEHVATNAGRGEPWIATLNFLWDFLGSEAILLNPIFFFAMLWAMIGFWSRAGRNPLLLFFFSMGAPVFLGYMLFTLHKRVFPNWIAPAVLPLFCLMIVFWHQRWGEGARAIKKWLTAGVAIGAALVVLLHNTDLLGKLAGRTLPADKDPLRRVRAWKDTASVVGDARRQFLTEGKPVFIIGDHYGMVGEISFYLPEARAAVRGLPLVYYKTARHPENQFYFWPGYHGHRQGENAIFVREVDSTRCASGWFLKWLAGRNDFLLQPEPEPEPIAAIADLETEFESVSEVGVYDIKYRDRVFRRVQLFACRRLR